MPGHEVEVARRPASSQTWAPVAAHQRQRRRPVVAHQRGVQRSVYVVVPTVMRHPFVQVHGRAVTAAPCVPTPASVKTSSSSDVRDPAVEDVRLRDAAAHGPQAGLHLGDHAAGQGRQQRLELGGREIVADDLGAGRPVGVQALDVGEDDELLGAQRDRERGGGGVGVDVVDLRRRRRRATLS